MNLRRWLQMRCRDEVAQLWADVHRLEGENAELTREALADRQRYHDVVECNHNLAAALSRAEAQLEKRTIELGDMRRKLEGTITQLRAANNDATAEIERLTEALDTAQYMRKVISKCRDDAEARANGYGKYTAGVV